MRLFSSSLSIISGFGKISTFKPFLEHILGILPLSIESLQLLHRKFLSSMLLLETRSNDSHNNLENFDLLYVLMHWLNSSESSSLTASLNASISTSTTCFSNNFLSQHLHTKIGPNLIASWNLRSLSSASVFFFCLWTYLRCLF